MTNTNVIDAFKGGYYVCEDGNVMGKMGKLLSKNPVTKMGYHYFSFRLFGKRTLILTHQLQAYQKFGNRIFETGIQVRHLNSNSLDNSRDNIEIGTQSQNQMDMDKNARRNRASNPKYNHELIVKDRNNGMTYKELMEKYNISSKGTVSFIINKSLIVE